MAYKSTRLFNSKATNRKAARSNLKKSAAEARKTDVIYQGALTSSSKLHRDKSQCLIVICKIKETCFPFVLI